MAAKKRTATALASSSLGTQPSLKKRKLQNEAVPGDGFVAPTRGKTAFAMDAIVKRTTVASKSVALDKRCDKCNGLPVQECLKLQYVKANGQKAKYTLADLRYDIQGKRLAVTGGTSPKKASPAPSAGLAKLPPLCAVKSAAAGSTLASGVRLPSGAIMPIVGFGTYKLKNHEVGKPVLTALKAGYRLIDTAQVYENEKGIGEALRRSGLGRGDVFIETKVWRSSHGYERTMKAFHQSLRHLGVNYIDLYVIHWPGCKTGWPLPRGTMCPPDWTPRMRDTGTWRAMEDLYMQGKVKAIGVTNYSVRHLKQLLKSCRVKPMVNQVEFHPRLVQSDLLSFCQKHGIAVQAYASLGSGDAAQAESFFAFPPICKAAAAHKVTPAQVLLRWALQKGCHVVPKSVRAERVAENAGVFGFKLSSGEMKAIDKLHNGSRYAWKGLDPDSIK
jgi:diketogulonate reductase-like aldo/keto reductase